MRSRTLNWGGRARDRKTRLWDVLLYRWGRGVLRRCILRCLGVSRCRELPWMLRQIRMPLDLGLLLVKRMPVRRLGLIDSLGW